MKFYLSNSKLGDAIRGTKKPVSATWEDWETWKLLAKKAHPIRYWIAEELFDYIDDVFDYIPNKINKVRYYINNRFVTKPHAMTADPKDIKPGTWCDLGDRFLYCMFNELVKFVECEKAAHYVMWDSDARKKYNTPFWLNHRWARWGVEYRNRAAGLDYLNWEMNLKMDESYGINPTDERYNQPTPQALAAIETNKLYYWWTIERLLRPDAYDISGWSSLCDARREKYGTLFSNEKSKEEREETDRVLNILHNIEEEYRNEDNEMIKRLIDIRYHLWT